MVFRRWRDRQGFFPRWRQDDNSDHLRHPGGNGEEEGVFVATAAVSDFERQIRMDDPNNEQLQLQLQLQQLPPDVEPQLATAWFAHRRHDLLQQRQQQWDQHRAQQAIGMQPPPVDVDNLSAWELDENAEPHRLFANTTNTSSLRRGKRRSATTSVAYEMDDAAIAHMSSTASIALSDCTPVMSNRQFILAPPLPIHRNSSKNHFISRTHTQHTVPPPPLSEDDDDDSSIVFEHQRCGGVFDRRSWQGKLLYSLLFLLFISLVTLVTTAVIYKGKNDSDGNGNASTINRSDDTGGGGGPMHVPSLSPVAATEAGGSTGGVSNPTTSPVAPTYYLDTGSPRAAPASSVPPPPTRVAPTTAPTTYNPNVTPATEAPSMLLNELADSLQITDTVNGTQIGDKFGSAIALSGDGKVLVVGAPLATSAAGLVNAGRVQVYAIGEDGKSWQERGAPIDGRAAEYNAGSAVALNHDGSVLALSEPKHNGGGERTGNVRVFSYNSISGNYDVLLGQELQGDVAFSYFGVALALSSSGQKLAVGASFFSGELRFQGQVRVFEYAPATNEWVSLGQPLLGSDKQDWFGYAVAMCEVDTVLTIVASAPHDSRTNGYVLAYQWDSSVQDWKQLGGNEMTNNAVTASSGLMDDFYGMFLSLANTSDTFRLAVGVPFKNDPTTGRENVGMTVVYELDISSNQWTVIGQPIVSDSAGDEAGTVKMLDEGNLLIVCAPGSHGNAGSVRMFRYDSSVNSFMPTTSSPTTLNGGAKGENFGIAVDATRRLEDNFLILAVAASGDQGAPGYVAILEEQ